MKASEVGIDVTVDIKVTSWLDNHAHVAGSMKVADKSLDGRCMTFLGAVAEPSDLTDGERDIRASIGGEIQQHSNN